MWRRCHRRVHVQILYDRLVAALTNLFLSFSNSRPEQFDFSSTLGPVPLQLSIKNFLYSSCSTFNTLASRPLGCDDGDGVLYNDVYMSTSFSSGAWDYSLGDYFVKADACFVQAEKVSMPSRAAAVPLLSILPANVAMMLSRPNPDVLRTELPEKLPNAVFMCAPQEYLKLVRRMLDCGMVRLTSKPKVVNGLFCLPKPDGTLRLIVDARPANALFVDAPPIELPTPDLLCKLEPTSPFYVAKSDISDFYHSIALPEWMCPYFCLPPLPGSLFGVGDCWVYPSILSVCMGYSWAVYLTQLAHIELFCRAGLPKDSLIQSSNDLRLDRDRPQIYIDDFIVYGPSAESVNRVLDIYMERMTEEGFLIKAPKLQRATQEPVECIGLLVDGARGIVRLAPEKHGKLIRQTLAVLKRGAATGTTLAKLLGKWVWCLLPRRPLLSVLSSSFRFVERAGPRLFSLWGSVARELQCLVDLSPLAVCSMFRRSSPIEMASDASPTGFGVCIKAREGEAAWSVALASAWRKCEHINILELRAISTAIRWFLRRNCTSSNLIPLKTDSMVALGALNKGRSPSPSILNRLRCVAAMLLASNSYLSLSYVPSNLNPADEASRRFANRHGNQETNKEPPPVGLQ